MKMMQTKRPRSIASRSSNSKIRLSSQVTTVLKPSTTVRTKKYDGDSKLTQFKTPPPNKPILLSPTKAARVKMLRARFCGTILKAQKTLFPNAKIVYQEVVVATPKVCSIQEKRQAARKALNNMKSIYDFNENLDATREFEKLIGAGSSEQSSLLANTYTQALQ